MPASRCTPDEERFRSVPLGSSIATHQGVIGLPQWMMGSHTARKLVSSALQCYTPDTIMTSTSLFAELGGDCHRNSVLRKITYCVLDIGCCTKHDMVQNLGSDCLSVVPVALL